MVNFVAVVDPIENRRKAYIKKIEAYLPLVDKLVVGSCTAGDFSVVWAAGLWAPVDYTVQDDGVALVFGDAIEGNQSKRLDARQLQKFWADSELPDPLDGFHAALSYNRKGRLMVGADLLGTFPIYYYAGKDVVLVGSSPELFRYHPSFDMKLDPEGLVGILLVKGLVNGKTLLRGVKRLAAGHLLRCSPDMQTSEVAQFKFPMSTKYFDLSLTEQVEVLDRTLEEAILRQVPRNEKCCLMLSGGLDSSLLAAYLERTGYEVVAVTEGLRTDNEMKCARRIAKTLGFKHVRLVTDYNDFARYSELNANWQHLSDGFTGVPFWRFHVPLRKEGSYVITGFSGDAVFGSLVDRSLANRGLVTSWNAFFQNINKDAFSPNALRKLLKKDYTALFWRIIREIEETHDSYPGCEFQRIWGFGLNQKIRYNDLSGIWSLSFGAWPIIPYSDHKILETVGGFPIESLVGRRVEKELLRIKFPKLAKLELARNIDFSPLPVVKGFQHKIHQQIYGAKGIWKFEIPREIRNLLLIKLRGERRYWRRQFRFDSPEWKIVRKKAEPFIPSTKLIFREEALENLMPSADSKYLQTLLKIRAFGVSTTSSVRIILGLAIWLQSHLDTVTNFQKDPNYE